MYFEKGIISWKLLIPVLYPALYQIRKLFIHDDDEKPIFEFFTNYLGYLCGGIIYLIIFCQMKKDRRSSYDENKNDKKQDLNEKDNDKGLKSQNLNNKETIKIESVKPVGLGNPSIQDEDKNNLKRFTFEKYGFILGLVLIYLIPLFLDSYCSTRDDLNFKTSSSMSLFFCIISYVCFSRKLLGDKIYRHQVFSLIIIGVCIILSNILIIAGGDNPNIWWNILFLFLIDALYGLYNVLEKKYFNKYMDTPDHLMFVIGLMSLIIVLLYETITFFALGKDWDFNGIFYQLEKNFENNNLYPLIFLGDIATAFVWILGIQLTVYWFTPCHFIISESVSQILSTFINNNLKDHSIYTKISVYFFSFIILIAAFIYNEVIIIKLYHLEDDTKKYILKRAEEKIDDNNIEEPIWRDSKANEENKENN